MNNTTKNRLLISGLLIIFLGLIAVAIWQGSSQTSQVDNNAPATRDPLRESAVFTGWAAIDIQALRLDDPYSEIDIALSRTADGAWQFATQQSVDQTLADNIAKTVAYMPYTDIIAGIPESEFVNYGLGIESIWLQIQVILNNNEQHVIAVGGRVPVADGGYYALVDDRTEVFVLNRGAVDYLGIFLQQYQTTE